jgi:diacylglycerol O-acyltransferase-1
VLAQIPELGNYSFDKWEQFPFVSGLLASQGFLMVAFVIEYLLARRGLYESIGVALHHINAHTSFGVCIFIVWNFIDPPAIGGVLLLVGAITWMKLISYALANQDYRLTKKRQKKNEDSFQATLAIIDNLDKNDWDIEYPM